MGLEGICALYSFRIKPPSPAMLRGGMGPLALDPYDRLAEDRRRAQEQEDRRAKEQERIEKSVYATPSRNLGFGTTENVSVDFSTQERIKTYFDALNNQVVIGHEPFGADHRKKKTLTLSELYPSGD